MHDGEKDVFFLRLYGLLHLRPRRRIRRRTRHFPEPPRYSIPIGPLFYSIRFRKWSFFVAAFTLRRFESQMKLDAGAAHDGDGLFSSPPH